jgi:hypothetical protein
MAVSLTVRVMQPKWTMSGKRQYMRTCTNGGERREGQPGGYGRGGGEGRGTECLLSTNVMTIKLTLDTEGTL